MVMADLFHTYDTGILIGQLLHATIVYMKYLALVFAFFAVASIIVGGFVFVRTQQRILENERLLTEQTQQIEKNKARFFGALSAAKIPQQYLVQGFWYEYVGPNGESELIFIDSETSAYISFTDEQLAEITKQLTTGRTVERAAMRHVPEAEMPKEMQFHNAVYTSISGGEPTIDMRQRLEARVQDKTYTSDDLQRLAYLYELAGEYTARDVYIAKNCAEFKKQCPDDAHIVTIKGHVSDLTGIPVQEARVEVLGETETHTTHTDEKGNYTLTTRVMLPEKVRIKATKRNFSEGVVSVMAVSSDKKAYEAPQIALASPITIVTIDTEKGTVTGSRSMVRSDGSFELKTDHSTYNIPRGAIVGADGKPYRGVADVYLYEFSQGSIPDGLMQVDTFDAVRGYAGDLMKTFGMPYIQFFTPDGTELQVLRSNPMTLTYQIVNMEELRTNKLGIYGDLTDADMRALVKASQENPNGYPIDRQFLIDHQLLRFPAFWVFDRKAGVWNNVGVNVLTTDGLMRTEFYTIKD